MVVVEDKSVLLTDLKCRRLEVPCASDVVCDCHAKIWEIEFDSGFIDSQRSKIWAFVEMKCSVVCREGSKREWH